MTTRVVLVGGGYVAVWCYRALRRWMRDDVEITLVTPYPAHVFHGFTGEVIAGEMPEEFQLSPYAECMPRAQLLQGWAVGVHPESQEVSVSRRGESTETIRIGYDHLVLAPGAREHTEPVPGLTQFGYPMRFPGDPEALGAAADAALASARADPSDVASRHAVVIGAGLAGVEAASALARRLGREGTVTLLNAGPNPVSLWESARMLQRAIRRSLDRDGVQVLDRTRAARVTREGVTLTDGRLLPAATVVSALGNAAPRMPGIDHLQGYRGLVRVNAQLQLIGPNVWAAGDFADVPRFGGGDAPKDALWAIQQGTRIGRNIARTVRGRRPRAFTFPGLGEVASFQPGHSVARMFGIPLTGVLAWTIRGGFFLWYVPSRRTAWRIVRHALGGRRKAEAVQPAVPTGPAIENELAA